jgi:hypothetical protein
MECLLTVWQSVLWAITVPPYCTTVVVLGGQSRLILKITFSLTFAAFPQNVQAPVQK